MQNDDSNQSFWSDVCFNGPLRDTKDYAILDGIERYCVSNDSLEVLPDVLMIQEWKRQPFPDKFGKDLLNNLVMELDEELQCEDSCLITTTPLMREAEETFLRIIREEYPITQHDAVGNAQVVDYDEIKRVASDLGWL